VPALREERPDRPIDQARGQDFLLAGPALALEEAARDLAGGKRLLLIIDRQGKKSTFSRTLVWAVAVTSTTVSP